MEKFLKNELERCKTAMTQNDPATEAYRIALQNLRELQYAIQYHNPAPMCQTDDFCTPPPDTEKGEEAPAKSAPAEEPKPDTPKLKKEDVRAALADARLKGVDVSKLIADLGAANLSSVDPDDYPKLMGALSKELEGK